MVNVIFDSREAATNPRLKKAIATMSEVDEFEEDELYVGDILFGNFLVERKATPDLLTSNSDGSLHIWDQLDRLIEMREKGLEICLLVEGKMEKAWDRKKDFNQRRMIQARINGILNSILFGYKIPVMQTQNYTETKLWLKNLVKRVSNPNRQSLKALRTHPRRKLSKKEKALYILQGFKGIGVAKSERILEEWHSLENFFACYYEFPNTFKPTFEKIVGKKYAEEFYKVMEWSING